MYKEKQVSLIIPYINESQFYLGLRLSDGGRYAFSLPGGHLKPNETPAQGATRELREETTLEIVPDTLTKLMQWSNPPDNCIIYLFSARVTGTPDGSKDPDQEFKKFKVVDFSAGVPIELIPHLHGPKDPQNNLLIRHFGIRTEKSLKDVPKGKEIESNNEKRPVIPGVPEKHFDYSHALSPEHVKSGYGLKVREIPSQPNFKTAVISHGGQMVGSVNGILNAQGALEPHANISLQHQNKGLGKAAYTALFAHALHNGHFKVQGGSHSDQAHYVHKSLAKQHGLDFRYLPEPGASDEFPHPGYETELK